MHFSQSFFHWAKPTPSGTRSLDFSNSRMRPSPRHGNACRIISLQCPHHGMEEWFIIQRFYHWLIRSTQEHIDAAAGGSFFTLIMEEAHKLIEKMASNQSWDEERTWTRTRKVHQLEEVDMLTAKIDLLLKKLDNPGLDHVKMVDVE